MFFLKELGYILSNLVVFKYKHSKNFTIEGLNTNKVRFPIVNKEFMMLSIILNIIINIQCAYD